MSHIVIVTQVRDPAATKGFTGSSCREASKFVEQALGHRSGERLTADFHQTQSVEQAQRQRC